MGVHHCGGISLPNLCQSESRCVADSGGEGRVLLGKACQDTAQSGAGILNMSIAKESPLSNVADTCRQQHHPIQ